MKLNPLLKIDFYKSTHGEQYNPGITKLVSYFTPRMTRLPDDNHLIMFGLQAYIKDYLIKQFNVEFFAKPKSVAVGEYTRIMDATLGKGVVTYERLEKLYDLGYLPLEIKALPEGTRVPVKVPMFEVSNTHPDFAWLTNTIETSISCTLWHAMLSANVGYRYRNIVNRYYEQSVEDNVPRARAVGDFSMRGQESVESAIKSSAGFALSFLSTATVPIIPFFEEYYGADCEKEPVAFGLTSTEHSVMCSNFAIDGDEITMLRRLLTEIYPNDSFNVVSDSYDYWNFVENLLPQCKDEILTHKGFVGIRGDSGDPVEIVTKTVFKLWEIFGGTVNSKGFKVLDSHVKAVYGDSITPQRLEQTYQVLIDNGFACNNVSLASGSFSMQCLEDTSANLQAEQALNEITKFIPEGYAKDIEILRKALEKPQFLPFTRDSFGIAIKATHAVVNGIDVEIFKDPVTDTGNFKKSQRGMCVVLKGEDGELTYEDGLTFAEAEARTDNVMEVVFRDGKMVKEYGLQEIRALLHDGRF